MRIIFLCPKKVENYQNLWNRKPACNCQTRTRRTVMCNVAWKLTKTIGPGFIIKEQKLRMALNYCDTQPQLQILKITSNSCNTVTSFVGLYLCHNFWMKNFEIVRPARVIRHYFHQTSTHKFGKWLKLFK